MTTLLLNSKVNAGQAPSTDDVTQREILIDQSNGSLWTKITTGLVRRIMAMAVPHASTHGANGADPITPASIGASAVDHQHTPLDLVGIGDIVTRNASEFASSTHTHGVGQVSGLSAQLDALAQRISALEQTIHPQ
jgi:hypothetical protein